MTLPRRFRRWTAAPLAPLVLLAVAGAVFGVNLGATRLWDQDEAYFARTAAEMWERGDLITPTFNGEVFAHKPPFMYWGMLAGFACCGVGELGARLGSAVCGVLTVLLTGHLGRRLFGREEGLWAGLMLATCVFFAVLARAATADVYLTCFTLAALAALVEGGLATTGPATGAARVPWRWAAAAYAAMGLAFLVKGPVGVLLPVAGWAGFAWLLGPAQAAGPSAASAKSRWLAALGARLHPSFLFDLFRSVRPLTGAVVVALVAGPWVAAVCWRTGPGFLAEFLGVHNVGRFLQPMDNHRGSVVYYLPAILLGAFPWTTALVPVLLYFVSGVRTEGPRRRPLLLAAVWAGVVVAFFSAAQTKLPNYVLPAYPPLALLGGAWLAAWRRGDAAAGQAWPRSAWAVWGLAGLLLIVGPLWLAQADLPLWERASPAVRGEVPLVSFVGAAAAVGAIAAAIGTAAGRRTWAAASLAASAGAICLVALAVVAVRVDRRQATPDLARAAAAESENGRGPLAEFRFFRPSLVFYAGRPVANCDDPSAAAALLQQPGARLITTRAHYEESLQGQLPPQVVVLERRPAFPERGEVLVLGRAEATPRVAEAPPGRR